LNKTDLEIVVGESFNLTAEIIPANATDKTISWSSSNPDIVTITREGVLTAIAEGEAIISVTSSDGNSQASCNVKVVQSAGIDGITTDGGDTPVEYYNLQGQRVNADALVPGIYIRRQGTKTEKVLIK